MEGEIECLPPDEDKEERKGKRGPIKRSKARNLLDGGRHSISPSISKARYSILTASACSWSRAPPFSLTWVFSSMRKVCKVSAQYCWSCEAYACALVLSGRRAKKPIHDGSQKNELNGYTCFSIYSISKGPEVYCPRHAPKVLLPTSKPGRPLWNLYYNRFQRLISIFNFTYVNCFSI
jgi:hypothetical protein